MKRVVIVTGGAGYIGSHACKSLAEAGYHPVVIDNLVYGHKWAVRWGPLIEVDILDKASLDDVFKEYNPLAVMHFAAFAYVGESVLNPAKYYQNNVAGTIALLECMRGHGCNHIVFSSTCATYGDPQEVPISEGHAQLPINPYGRSKLMIEQILKDYEHAYGTRFATLRYFNAAGADQDGKIGEDHDPETHLIPLIIQVALGLRQHVEIFGTDYPTPDGTAIRDYIHVSDLAEAHVLALEAILNNNYSLSLNLGTGKGHSVRDVIEEARRVSGRDIMAVETPRRAGDPAILVAKADKANQVLGWAPQYADIDSIISTAWRWHTQHLL